MANWEIVELHRNSANWPKTLGEIVRIEKKIFPKHESLAKTIEEELRKKNCGLLYSEIGGEVAGYVMYSWPSSLFASITKLAGSILNAFTLSLTFFNLFRHNFYIWFIFLCNILMGKAVCRTVPGCVHVRGRTFTLFT